MVSEQTERRPVTRGGKVSARSDPWQVGEFPTKVRFLMRCPHVRCRANEVLSYHTTRSSHLPKLN